VRRHPKNAVHTVKNSGGENERCHSEVRRKKKKRTEGTCETAPVSGGGTRRKTKRERSRRKLVARTYKPNEVKSDGKSGRGEAPTRGMPDHFHRQPLQMDKQSRTPKTASSQNAINDKEHPKREKNNHWATGMVKRFPIGTEIYSRRSLGKEKGTQKYQGPILKIRETLRYFKSGRKWK